MKTALIDINVILDVLLDRAPHARASASVWAAIEERRARGLLAAHAVTTIYYLIGKETGNAKAKRIFGTLFSVFGVASVDKTVIDLALKLPGSDFEDTVTAAAAQNAGCDFIVTRDTRGFRGSPVPAVTPEMAVQIIASYADSR